MSGERVGSDRAGPRWWTRHTPSTTPPAQTSRGGSTARATRVRRHASQAVAAERSGRAARRDAFTCWSGHPGQRGTLRVKVTPAWRRGVGLGVLAGAAWVEQAAQAGGQVGQAGDWRGEGEPHDVCARSTDGGDGEPTGVQPTGVGDGGVVPAGPQAGRQGVGVPVVRVTQYGRRIVPQRVRRGCPVGGVADRYAGVADTHRGELEVEDQCPPLEVPGEPAGVSVQQHGLAADRGDDQARHGPRDQLAGAQGVDGRLDLDGAVRPGLHRDAAGVSVPRDRA